VIEDEHVFVIVKKTKTVNRVLFLFCFVSVARIFGGEKMVG
jgi:hypothetical protein